jgi:hypothetical protein
MAVGTVGGIGVIVGVIGVAMGVIGVTVDRGTVMGAGVSVTTIILGTGVSVMSCACTQETDAINSRISR